MFHVEGKSGIRGRQCIGEPFALLEMAPVAAAIGRRFRMTLARPGSGRGERRSGVAAPYGRPMYCGGLVFGRRTCYVTAMGHVYQRVKLGAVNEEDLTILVDTGATLSLIPPALADRLGITRLPRKQV